MSNVSLKELIEFVAKALVDQPDQVEVSEIAGEQTIVLELRVAKEDLGKVIGKQGRTVKAMRAILNAASSKLRKRADIEILDDVRPSGWVGFAGQHDVRVTGPDRVSMYDAGLGDSSNVGDPRYVEYQVDVASGTAEKVDEHVWTDWGNGKAGGMAQQLPMGGVLIGFGSLTEGDDGTKVPLATELSPDGEEVWHLYGPDATWSYRAWRQYGDPFDGTWAREP